MGAGISEKRASGIIRRQLRKIENELREAGIPCHYHRRTVSNGAERRTEEPSLPQEPSHTFQFYYSHGHMSNGESVILCTLFVRPIGAQKCEIYNWQNWNEGMARVKSLFGVHSLVESKA